MARAGAPLWRLRTTMPMATIITEWVFVFLTIYSENNKTRHIFRKPQWHETPMHISVPDSGQQAFQASASVCCRDCLFPDSHGQWSSLNSPPQAPRYFCCDSTFVFKLLTKFIEFDLSMRSVDFPCSHCNWSLSSIFVTVLKNTFSSPWVSVFNILITEWREL